MKCKNCDKETKNPKFCSRSCAAIQNNIKHPKRLPEGKCVDCKIPIINSRKRCPKCRRLLLKKQDITLEEILYTKHIRAAAFALVRYRAKSSVQNLPRFQSCENCGYNKHIEIAHIQDICDFPLTTKVSYINRLENLKSLCPNCHWEFDEEKRKLKRKSNK